MMTSTRNRYRIQALAIYVTMGVLCAPLWGQSLPSPSETDVDIDGLVQEQWDLAEAAPDRDTRLVHLRKALAIRPDDPDNLAIDFRIAVELSQRYDPKYPDQRPRREEALVLYEELLKKYEHMDYYRSRPGSGGYDPQMAVARAAIHLAGLYRGVQRDPAKARECLVRAMECLNATYEKRVEDWLSVPEPVAPDPDSLAGQMSLRAGGNDAQIAHWKERRQKALEGDVLSSGEMTLVKVAIRQYGETHGRQRPGEVPVVMGKIVKMFPDTPLAKVAQGHIDRAVAMALADPDGDLALDELDLDVSASIADSELGSESPTATSRPAGDGPVARTAPAPLAGRSLAAYWLVAACLLLFGILSVAWFARRDRVAGR